MEKLLHHIINHQRYFFFSYLVHIQSFPGGSDSKESCCNAGDPGSIPGLERSPGEGNGTPLQYSCLENPMDGGAWQVTVRGSQRVRHDWGTSLSYPYPYHFHSQDPWLIRVSHMAHSIRMGEPWIICVLIDYVFKFHFIDFFLLWAFINCLTSSNLSFLTWKAGIIKALTS